MAAIEAPECLLCRPSDGMARRPIDPSRPAVRPDCLSKLLMSHLSQHPFGRASWGSSTWSHLEDRRIPFGADNVARSGNCHGSHLHLITHPHHTPLGFGSCQSWSAGLTLMLSLVLLQLECRRLARAPLWSLMVLRAAASMDGKNVAVAGAMRN